MTDKPIRIAAIVGPTASGKTSLSVALAERMSAEIISCDSMQLYRRMSIGTAKPTREEQKGIRHHLLDCIDPETSFSAADYATHAETAVNEILSRGKTPLFSGGTGLYLDAFLRGGLPPQEEIAPALLEELNAILEREGKEALYSRLVAVDPAAAEKTHPNNVRRVLRSLALSLSGDKNKTERDAEKNTYSERYDPTVVGLLWDRALLCERIDLRVEEMFRMGLLEETERLLREGVFEASATAAQAIGYKELFPYFRGEASLDAVKERLKIATHQYAKRQMTWFRAHGNVVWVPMDDGKTPLKFEEIVNNVARVFRDRGFCVIMN